ncbi:Signal recognition particle 19 kDa protein [Tupaia chinensis]|uniref:Signal recognition particle 19 kDa protein n=1 Tax=Tupaia chinensis TaxID=246437 RepID=L9L1X6_TUPCH|nr:Signal recognition particle 19 kDa protein [Tupaia chinensis]
MGGGLLQARWVFATVLRARIGHSGPRLPLKLQAIPRPDCKTVHRPDLTLLVQLSSQFVCIYPAYLNNKKTIAEGRRIPVSKVSATGSSSARPLDKPCRFVCIYPAYLNNKKTIAEGRRIPVSKAVENPTATEIQDVCSAVGLNVFLECLQFAACGQRPHTGPAATRQPPGPHARPPSARMCAGPSVTSRSPLRNTEQSPSRAGPAADAHIL